MPEPRNPHAWIAEKKSWLITTNSKSMGSFEPVDPAAGIWTREELVRHLGPGEVTVLPLVGRWAGEVLVAGTDPDRPDHFLNDLAGNLCREALGSYHRLYGPVLMTLVELLATEVRISKEPARKTQSGGEESGSCR